MEYDPYGRITYYQDVATSDANLVKTTTYFGLAGNGVDRVIPEYDSVNRLLSYSQKQTEIAIDANKVEHPETMKIDTYIVRSGIAYTDKSLMTGYKDVSRQTGANLDITTTNTRSFMEYDPYGRIT